jgi:hypothetical protein
VAGVPQFLCPHCGGGLRLQGRILPVFPPDAEANEVETAAATALGDSSSNDEAAAPHDSAPHAVPEGVAENTAQQSKSTQHDIPAQQGIADDAAQHGESARQGAADTPAERRRRRFPTSPPQRRFPTSPTPSNSSHVDAPPSPQQEIADDAAQQDIVDDTAQHDIGDVPLSPSHDIADDTAQHDIPDDRAQRDIAAQQDIAARSDGEESQPKRPRPNPAG